MEMARACSPNPPTPSSSAMIGKNGQPEPLAHSLSGSPLSPATLSFLCVVAGRWRLCVQYPVQVCVGGGQVQQVHTPGPRGLTEQDPPRVGASRLVLWGEPGGIRVGPPMPRRSLSCTSSWTPVAGALGLRVRRGRVPSRSRVPQRSQAEVPKPLQCPAVTAAANRRQVPLGMAH